MIVLAFLLFISPLLVILWLLNKLFVNNPCCCLVRLFRKKPVKSEALLGNSVIAGECGCVVKVRKESNRILADFDEFDTGFVEFTQPSLHRLPDTLRAIENRANVKCV